MTVTVTKRISKVSLSTRKICRGGGEGGGGGGGSKRLALLTLSAAQDESEWATSCPCRFILLKELRYPMNRRLGGPQSRSECFGKDKPDIFTLLGCYTAFLRSRLPSFRDNLSVPSSRVKQSKTTLQDGTDRLSRNVDNYLSTLL